MFHDAGDPLKTSKTLKGASLFPTACHFLFNTKGGPFVFYPFYWISSRKFRRFSCFELLVLLVFNHLLSAELAVRSRGQLKCHFYDSADIAYNN